MLIEKSLTFLSGELEAFLKQRMGDNGNKERIVLSNIVKQNGEIAIGNDQAAIMLVNIEEESSRKSQNAFVKNGDGVHQKVNPELLLNLFLLIAANFVKYEESLKTISHVVSFYQSRSVFDRTQYPEMDASLSKLTINLQTMNFEQMNHLWGALGAKYMPSVLYKMRALVVQEAEIKDEVLPIEEINIESGM